MAELDKTKESINFITLYVIIVSSLAGCLYGLDIGVIGGALGFIKKEMHLTAVQTGWIVGAVLYGGAVAILVTGFLADFFGRKKMIVVSFVIFILGVVWSTFAYSYTSLLIGRLIMGIGVGISAMLVPVYLSESIPAHIRGRAIACFQLFLTAGILLAYLVDIFFVKSENWRAMFGVLAIPGVILLIGSLFLPESPTWYFIKNKLEKSKKNLRKFHDDDNARIILGEMQALREEKKNDVNKSIFKKAYIVPFVIGLLIACLNQTTGINSVLQYAPIIFKHSGVHSTLLTVILGTGVTFINFIVTIIAITLIDKLGRKPLLIFSTAGVTISLIFLGIAFLIPADNLRVALLLLGMFGFIISYAIGCGVVVWLAMSELLPTSIRSMGIAICLFCNSMLSSILATLFPVVQEHIGYSGLFFILAGFTLIYFIVAAFFLPETKGKTIEEIEEYFR